MSDYQIDGTPAETGDNPLIHFLQREFGRLHKRVDALDSQRREFGQRMQPARPNVALNTKPSPAAGVTSAGGSAADATTKAITPPVATSGAISTNDTPNGGASGPLWELQMVLAEIAQATVQLTDLQIVGYRDACKQAIMDLRSGMGDGSVTDTAGTIAYQLQTHDAFIEVIGVLLDAARSRDPYAAQLQIG